MEKWGEMISCPELENAALKTIFLEKFRYWSSTSALGSHALRSYSKTEVIFFLTDRQFLVL